MNDITKTQIITIMAEQNTDALPAKREIRDYDTKLIWEQFLNEILETRRELSERLDRIEANRP